MKMAVVPQHLLICLDSSQTVFDLKRCCAKAFPEIVYVVADHLGRMNRGCAKALLRMLTVVADGHDVTSRRRTTLTNDATWCEIVT